MNFSTVRKLALAIFLLSPAALAQSVGDCSMYPDNSSERSRCEEAMLHSARILAGTRFLEADKSLIPDAPGAWVLHIVTHGGFHGQGLPTVTIRSTGEYACGEKEPLQFRALADDQTMVLSNLVLWPEFRTPKKLTRIEPSDGPFCSDCFFGKIIFARRETNGKIKLYDSSSKIGRYVESVERLNSIRSFASEYVECK